jgi:hypothetical protein
MPIYKKHQKTGKRRFGRCRLLTLKKLNIRYLDKFHHGKSSKNEKNWVWKTLKRDFSSWLWRYSNIRNLGDNI